MVDSGCAMPTDVSPTAAPTRASPKSNAITVVPCIACCCARSASACWAGGCGSRMTGLFRQRCVIDAEHFHCARQALRRRQLENHVIARFDRQPRVLGELMLELARRPACIAKRYQHLARAFAARD